MVGWPREGRVHNDQVERVVGESEISLDGISLCEFFIFSFSARNSDTGAKEVLSCLGGAEVK